MTSDGNEAVPPSADHNSVHLPTTGARSNRTETQSPRGNAANMTAAALTGDLPKFEETLKMLVGRIAKILQAEKCVFLLHDPEMNHLRAVVPALGLTYEQIGKFRVKVASAGITAQVFRSGVPAIISDAAHDPVASIDRLAEKLFVRDGICVPLIIEKRDDDNNIIERETIGVLYVFNKTTLEAFTHEDVSLLTRMSFSTVSFIKSAQVFREAVQEKQELINTIESLYLGLVVVGFNGRILQMNPSARLILSVPNTLPTVGMPYPTVIESEKLISLISQALETEGHEVTGEINVPAPPGGGDDSPAERIFQVQGAPVRGDGQEEPIGVALLMHDITEIRSVERMKTAFISTVSHELRTPLTSIKGFIATLLSDTEGFYDGDTQREFFRIIDTECDRLTRLIDDLLNVSKIEQGRAMQLNVEPISVAAVANKVLTAQRAYAKPDRHQLFGEFPADFPVVEADQDKMDQILTNLVNNAIKYSPHGGAITITGRSIPSRGEIEIRVSDQGMGIPKDHLPKVWDRFHRVDNRDNREIGGTGIGLFLVKALVEAHHGRVNVESEYGKGTTFSFKMPTTQPPDEMG